MSIVRIQLDNEENEFNSSSDRMDELHAAALRTPAEINDNEMDDNKIDDPKNKCNNIM